MGGGTATISDGDITTAKLADNAVPATKIAAGTIASSRLDLSNVGTNFWRTHGNVGITAGTYFIGTTDAQDLEFRINDNRALRINQGLGNGHHNFVFDTA